MMNILGHEKILFLDTETTGFAKGGPHNQNGQARICQAAFVLTDASGRVMSQYCSLVKPDQWEISEGAYGCHGISTDDCEKHGTPMSIVMRNYFWFMYNSDLVVAHNIGFDRRMFEIEEGFDADYIGDKFLNVQAMKNWYCTQKNSKNVCKIPPTQKMLMSKRNGFKTPNLQEALYNLTGKTMTDAHDALADTMACKDIFFALNNIKV